MLRYFTLLSFVFAISLVSVAQSGSSTNIKNRIKISTDGLSVSKAYLTDKDGKEMSLNQTRLNEPVYLNLEISGWQVTDGKVNIGASEKITTDKNALILYQDDLFPGKTDYKAEDARYIRLKAVITSISNPDIKSFTVKARVWDKNTGNSVTGSYTFTVIK